VTASDDETRAALDAAALSRVLDGLDVPDDADEATADAHARAAADVALLSRAFGVLGDALAAEPAAPARIDVPDNVVALPLWRRRPGRIFLAAAASIAVMGLGLGVLVANNDDGGSDVNHSATAGGAAVAQAPPAPMDAERSSASGYATNSAAADSTATAPLAAAPAAPAAAAPAAAAASAPTAKTAKSASADDGTGESLEDAVACARGILIGRIVSFTPATGGKVSLTLDVTEWISPGSGPARVTYVVGDNDEDGSGSTLKKGQQRLFVVPRSTSASVYTFVGPDYDAAKAKVAKAQAADADQQC
jgi:hypothetical protein